MKSRPSPMKHPIEFITFINASRIGNSSDKVDGNAITESLNCDSDIDFNDECIDPDSDFTSLDGASTPPWPLTGANRLDDINIGFINTPSQPSLSRTYNSDSSGIITDTVSYDGPSIRSDTIAKNMSPSEHVCHMLYPEYTKSSDTHFTFTIEHEYRSCRNRPNIVSCESTSTTSTTTSNIRSSVLQHPLYCSNRVQELRARRRSSELRYYRKRSTPSKRSMVQSTSTDASCDPNDTLVCNKLSSSHHQGLVSMMQSMIEVAGKIICFNTSLYMMYLLFVFYKYSLSIVIQSFQQFGFAL